MLNAEPSGIDSIRFAEKGTLRMTFTVESQAGHGAYIHRSEGAIRIATKLIQRLLTLEDLRGEGMDPDLREYLQRDDVREVADKTMGDGAAKSKQIDGQEGDSNCVATACGLILTELTFCPHQSLSDNS